MLSNQSTAFWRIFKKKFAVKITVRKGTLAMARRGENIYKRKDGRYEGRYIRTRDENGKAIYGYVYARSYSDVKEKLAEYKAVSLGKNILRTETAGLVTLSMIMYELEL